MKKVSDSCRLKMPPPLKMEGGGEGPEREIENQILSKEEQEERIRARQGSQNPFVQPRRDSGNQAGGETQSRVKGGRVIGEETLLFFRSASSRGVERELEGERRERTIYRPRLAPRIVFQQDNEVN